MARDPERRTLSRQLDNIRKRYNRSAARYEKQAESATPAMAAALRTAARNERAEAEKYRSKRGERLADLRSKVQTGLEQSETVKALVIKQTGEQQNALARTRIRGNAGAKFYAATQSIWRGKGYVSRETAIVDYFNENASHISADKRAEFAEVYGYELKEPLTLLDAQNLLELNTGIDLDASETDPREEYESFKRRGALAVAKMMI